MPDGERPIRTGRRRHVHRRLAEFETELEETSDRVRRLENTLQEVVRNDEDVSLGGPCKCNKSLLIVREREIYCPVCDYQRTM